MDALSLRPVVPDDLVFLEEMLLEAAYWRTGPSARGAVRGEVRQRPELAVYVHGWGRRGDRGHVAWCGGERLGAAWYRLFDEAEHGYGYLDGRTPELSVGVVRAWRGIGVGRALLTALVAQAAIDGHARMSLSAERDNPALRLYERLGFEQLSDADGSVIMTLAVGR
jgi:GNAT superfamily N-acetyltransferase